MSANVELNSQQDKDTEKARGLEERIRKLQTIIDQRVYALYELTPDEVSIVEKATALAFS